MLMDITALTYWPKCGLCRKPQNPGVGSLKCVAVSTPPTVSIGGKARYLPRLRCGTGYADCFMKWFLLVISSLLSNSRMT